MTNGAREGTIPALLTDEAVSAITDMWGDPTPDIAGMVREEVEAFLRHHASEGREALVGELLDVLKLNAYNDGTWQDAAEAVVTALTGGARSAA